MSTIETDLLVYVDLSSLFAVFQSRM